MIDIIILGRGGQGAQTAGNQLARAFFAKSLHVQVFSTYGGARRGTPVTSSLRVDTAPIRLRCNITCASAVLCFDDSLLDATLMASAAEDAPIMVNSARTSEELGGGPHQIIPLDGSMIARRNNMGKVVNSALLGGFVAALGQPDIETMCRIIEDTAPVKKAENVAACREAYGLMTRIAEEV
jgi:pyruvate ferredoxin oxidoreductase gamma subunit